MPTYQRIIVLTQQLSWLAHFFYVEQFYTSKQLLSTKDEKILKRAVLIQVRVKIFGDKLKGFW